MEPHGFFFGQFGGLWSGVARALVVAFRAALSRQPTE